MPFTFKLSRRLAGIPAAMLVASIIVVACACKRPTEQTLVVAHVELLPVAVTVQPDQSVTCTAVHPRGEDVYPSWSRQLPLTT